MRRLRILVAASVLALGALPSPVWAGLFGSSINSNIVLRYGGGTGAFINAFVAVASGGSAYQPSSCSDRPPPSPPCPSGG